MDEGLWKYPEAELLDAVGARDGKVRQVAVVAEVAEPGVCSSSDGSIAGTPF